MSLASGHSTCRRNWPVESRLRCPCLNSLVHPWPRKSKLFIGLALWVLKCHRSESGLLDKTPKFSDFRRGNVDFAWLRPYTNVRRELAKWPVWFKSTKKLRCRHFYKILYETPRISEVIQSIEETGGSTWGNSGEVNLIYTFSNSQITFGFVIWCQKSANLSAHFVIAVGRESYSAEISRKHALLVINIHL